MPDTITMAPTSEIYFIDAVYPNAQRLFTAGERLGVGDAVMIQSVFVRRKWWQLWKPREWREDRLFKVNHASGEQMPDAMIDRPIIHYTAPGYGIIRPPACGANEGWRKPGEKASFVQVSDDPMKATCPSCIARGLPNV